MNVSESEQQKSTPDAPTTPSNPGVNSPVVEDISLHNHAPDLRRRARVTDEEWDDFTRRVKDANPIEVVVGLDAQLERKGEQFVCSSPLPGRDDSTPSFYVTPAAHQGPSKPPWHDFGGEGQSGDVISYVELTKGLSFLDARRWLAERAGIEPPQGSGEPPKPEDVAKESERKLVERVWDAYVTECCAALPDDIRAHLKNHYGFTDKSIKEFRFGYDNGGSWHALQKLGFENEALYKSGIYPDGAIIGTSQFETRIIIPYLRHGKVVYLIGRATKYTRSYPKRDSDKKVVTDEKGEPVLKEPPKYIKLQTNTEDDTKGGPKTPISSISKTVSNEWFYGEDDADGKPDMLLVAEGVLDCAAIRQAGFKCISPVTTTFRKQDEPKLAALSKNAKAVGLVPDQEDNGAGMKGATSTAKFLADLGVDVRLVILPHDDIKKAAEERQEAERAKILAAGGNVEEEKNAKAIKKAGAWKIDANEFLAATPTTRAEAAKDFTKLVEGAPTYIEYLIGPCVSG